MRAGGYRPLDSTRRSAPPPRAAAAVPKALLHWRRALHVVGLPRPLADASPASSRPKWGEPTRNRGTRPHPSDPDRPMHQCRCSHRNNRPAGRVEPRPHTSAPSPTRLTRQPHESRRSPTTRASRSAVRRRHSNSCAPKRSRLPRNLVPRPPAAGPGGRHGPPTIPTALVESRCCEPSSPSAYAPTALNCFSTSRPQGRSLSKAGSSYHAPERVDLVYRPLLR